MLVSASIGTLLVTALMDANVASSRMYKQIKEKSDAEWHIRLARTLIRKMPDNTDILKCIQELNKKVKIADGFSFAVRQDGTDFYIVVASDSDTEDRLTSPTEIKTDNIYLKTSATPSPDYDSEAIQITSSLVSNVNTPECALLDEDYSPACYEVIDDKNDPKFGQHKIACEQNVGSLTLANNVVAFGLSAGKINTGNSNTFIGNFAGRLNKGGDSNTFIGNQAGKENITGRSNTFIGNQAGFQHKTGIANTFIGSQAGFNDVNGNGNIFIGQGAGKGLWPIISADRNIFLGNVSGELHNEGGGNAYLGHSSGSIHQSGFNNIYVGYRSGCYHWKYEYYCLNSSNNIFIGAAYKPVQGEQTIDKLINIGNVIIGKRKNNDRITSLNQSDIGVLLPLSEYPTSAGVKIRGDLEVEDILKVKDLKVSGSVEFTGLIGVQKTSCVNAKIKAGFLTMKQNGNADCGVGSFIRTQSDRSLKKNIKSLENELENLLALKPSMYYWKNKDLTPKKQFGLIAQDVETIYPNLVYKDEDTKKLSLNYMGFIAVIIQSIKELHKSFNQSIQELHKNFSNSISNLKIGIQDLRLQDKALELKDKKLKDDLELLKLQDKKLKADIEKLKNKDLTPKKLTEINHKLKQEAEKNRQLKRELTSVKRELTSVKKELKSKTQKLHLLDERLKKLELK